MIPIQAQAGEAATLCVLLPWDQSRSFGNLLITWGVTGWELQLLGCSFGLGDLGRAAESCHRPCRGKRCWVVPLATDLLTSSDLALPAWLGF